MKVQNKGGTVYRIRYRKRRPEDGWAEFTETLRDCPSMKAARKILDERLEEINSSNGGMANGGLKKLSNLVGSVWPQYLDARNVKDSTRYTWGCIVEKWILPFFRDRVLDDIEPSDVGDFMSHLKAERLAIKYQRNIYSILKLMFDVARENDFMKSSPIRPKIHRPKSDNREKPTWSTEQAKSILTSVNPMYRAPLWTLALTGLRAGELLALRWCNIDFLGRSIVITHSLWRGRLQNTKTKTSDRKIGMSAELESVLMEHRRTSQFKDSDDFVFCQLDGRPMDPDSLRRSGIYPALEAAGVPYRKRASGCHTLRHLVASIIHRETGSLKLAQKQLGHSNISTTGDIYTHVENEEMAETASIIGKALAGTCGRSVVETAEETTNVQ